jgi:hypothetical protein
MIMGLWTDAPRVPADIPMVIAGWRRGSSMCQSVAGLGDEHLLQGLELLDALPGAHRD